MAMNKKEIAEMEKPNNLLFEVFSLGMQAAISGTMSGKPKEVAKICEKEMDDLAKMFGFTGLDYFDQYLTTDLTKQRFIG